MRWRACSRTFKNCDRYSLSSYNHQEGTKAQRGMSVSVPIAPVSTSARSCASSCGARPASRAGNRRSAAKGSGRIGRRRREPAVVGRRQIDDLPIAGNRHLLVRRVRSDRADVDRAPVAAVRHRSAEDARSSADGVESLMREHRAMDARPSASESCRLPSPRRSDPPAHRVKRPRHRLLAGLRAGVVDVVAPRARAGASATLVTNRVM